MGEAVINLVVIPKRMLTKTQAASHCGRLVKRLEIECPVRPVRFANGDERWDIQDLDEWLDSLKTEHEDVGLESIIRKLG